MGQAVAVRVAAREAVGEATAPLHRQVPDWSLVSQKLAPSEELLQEDMTRWVAALDRLLPVMENMHKALDLEDQRKSL